LNLVYNDSAAGAVTALNDSTITTTSRLFSGLLTSKTYLWRVRGKNSLGWGTWTPYSTFYTVDSSALVENPSTLPVYWDVALRQWVRGAPKYIVIQKTQDADVYIPKSDALITIGSEGTYGKDGKQSLGAPYIYFGSNFRLRYNATAGSVSNSATVTMECLPEGSTNWIPATYTNGVWSIP
jgi:hypothetical protein